MQTRSVWHHGIAQVAAPALDRDLTVDTAIVGAGITGATLAMLLSQAGQRVALLEAGEIGDGTTGNSTGNLYATVGTGLSQLLDRWGEAVMRAVVASRSAAIDRIEQTAGAYGIDCRFARRSWFLSALHERQLETLASEHRAALAAGLAPRWDDRNATPFAAVRTLAIDGQAQFNPLAYVRGVVRAIDSPHCRVFQHTRVVSVDPRKRRVRAAGGSVSANDIVLATHTPLGFNLVQTEIAPYREYGVAAAIGPQLPPAPERGNEVQPLPGRIGDGIFWSVEPRLSLRSYDSGDERFAVIVGGQHKTGHRADAQHAFDELESALRERVSLQRIAYRWSAQSYHAADGLPYIGRSARARHLHVATGFAADGLTWGSVAARILADSILDRPNPHAALYKATRITPLRSASSFVRENADVVAQYAKDWIGPADAQRIAQIPAGQGRIVDVGNRKLAVYKSPTSKLSAVSPVCTHLKCIVHWNAAETSWDCPCHGSRFDVDGRVLEGPALAPLKRVRLPSQ